MIHSKSKSTKSQENEKEIKKNSLNYINKDSTKDNLNLNLIINENENYAKISNLLCEHDNDDKIVNISKLDEVLYSDERKPKNNELFQKHMEGDSKFDLIIGDQNESDNTNPIINISNLEISIFKSEQNEQNVQYEQSEQNEQYEKNKQNEQIDKNDREENKKKDKLKNLIPLNLKGGYNFSFGKPDEYSNDAPISRKRSNEIKDMINKDKLDDIQPSNNRNYTYIRNRFKMR